MVLDLNVFKTDDGFNAEIPSLNGCESWAHSEDEVIQKMVDLIRYYLKLSDSVKIIVDRSRRNGNLTIYKAVFEK